MNAADPDDGDEGIDDLSLAGEDSAQAARVPSDMNGQRLDAVAARLFPDWSRSRIQTWLADGRLRVNGAVVTRARTPVGEEDLLELEPVAEPDFRIEPQEMAFDVLHADAHLAVVFKPAGLTTHPGAGQPDRTLQNGLLHRFPQTASVPRAGIVHRLDKDTSGVLVIALTLSAHAKLVAMLARREIRREYDAVINGTPVSGGTIDLPIGRSPRDRLKMAVVDHHGRDAVTHYRIQERFSHHTHLRVKLETGRTHQIRVHFAHQRMPLAGDTLYGGGGARGVGLSDPTRDTLRAFRRQALHARELAFAHPITGEPVCVSAEMPPDLTELIEALRRG
ncbi:ribosomal large subunit pseudouridine synthase D [Panacagrimonas perspica]|uniref:Pseudouridine synthase n=1 Tax=Panacagrimonas perspica TaxID=381431 RepID=A0A4V3F4U1_9GAMM|nr:23S rRNA pseudouridine(1911/1915/1917) synthase RluD [Panacagrimonas perspica]TDU26566.1 ribosomal large subunit pseudouridine synthase D [Panacagrimonas perspica]THD03932.1 23S rRNA pseudouridine(1911/1915/1917) synthase [Panacagrimonas perspica]